MSKAQPIRPRMATRAPLAFAMIASQFNLPYVQALVDHAHRELNELEPGTKVALHWVPGSFEIPLLAKLMAARKRYHAILAFGVIIEGETAHAGFIGQSVSNALMRLSLDCEVPVIHQVLLVKNEEQARERCMGRELNRGIEAARAAVATARTVQDVLARQG